MGFSFTLAYSHPPMVCFSLIEDTVALTNNSNNESYPLPHLAPAYMPIPPAIYSVDFAVPFLKLGSPSGGCCFRFWGVPSFHPILLPFFSQMHSQESWDSLMCLKFLCWIPWLYLARHQACDEGQPPSGMMALDDMMMIEKRMSQKPAHHLQRTRHIREVQVPIDICLDMGTKYGKMFLSPFKKGIEVISLRNL